MATNVKLLQNTLIHVKQLGGQQKNRPYINQSEKKPKRIRCLVTHIFKPLSSLLQSIFNSHWFLVMFAFVISGPIRLPQFWFYRGSIEVRSTERIVQYILEIRVYNHTPYCSETFVHLR